MSKIRVLYAEDEPFLGRIVKETLESKDYHVTHVADGGLVMTYFEKFKPDICLLDIMMPHKDGFEVAREIRKKDENIPILFLTAKDQTKDVLKGFELGANDYIRKPFSMEELIVRMKNLLKIIGKKDNSLTLESLHFASFTLLLKTQQLISEGIEIQLSHKEFSILNLMAQRPNEVIERKDILDKVWGDDTVYNSRTLDVYITKLRNYLKSDDRLRIMTLKGIGYKFVVEE